jgi:hypothetical protein
LSNLKKSKYNLETWREKVLNDSSLQLDAFFPFCFSLRRFFVTFSETVFVKIYCGKQETVFPLRADIHKTSYDHLTITILKACFSCKITHLN